MCRDKRFFAASPKLQTTFQNFLIAYYANMFLKPKLYFFALCGPADATHHFITLFKKKVTSLKKTEYSDRIFSKSL